MKRNKFAEGEIYHICNKSISHFNIFHDSYLAERFLTISEYYNSTEYRMAYSQLEKYHKSFSPLGLLTQTDAPIVRFIAYCVMPDHYHLLIKPLINNNKVVYLYIAKLENGFTRYFNLNKHRKGPLWQSRFRSIRIMSNEQLLHITRYIHLNPVTDELVELPEKWPYSSYRHYMNQNTLANLKDISISNVMAYKRFVENNADYQKTLKRIKYRLLE